MSIVRARAVHASTGGTADRFPRWSTCLGMALGLHLLALGSGWWHAGTATTPAPAGMLKQGMMTLRAMPAPSVSPAPNRQAEVDQSQSQTIPVTKAQEAMEPPIAQVADQEAQLMPSSIRIAAPDAPLHSWPLALRVLALVGADGSLLELRNNASDRDDLAAFVGSATRALSSQSYLPSYRSGKAQAGSLCLELLFGENQPAAELRLMNGISAEECLAAPIGA